MKLRLFGLIILLVFCFGIVTAYAEEPKDQLLYLYDISVCPSKISEYEAAQKDLITVYQKYNFSVGFEAYQRNDLHYIYAISIESLSELEKMNKDNSSVFESKGFQAAIQKINNSTNYIHTFFSTQRADLSYIPESMRVKQKEVNFIFWNYFYVKNGKQIELENVWKEFVSLYKEKGIKDGWNMHVRGIGSKNPMQVGSLWAKNEADYYTQLQKTMELTGSKGEGLWKKAMSLCRKFEQKSAIPRPDLSYTPKAE